MSDLNERVTLHDEQLRANTSNISANAERINDLRFVTDNHDWRIETTEKLQHQTIAILIKIALLIFGLLLTSIGTLLMLVLQTR